MSDFFQPQNISVFSLNTDLKSFLFYKIADFEISKNLRVSQLMTFEEFLDM